MAMPRSQRTPDPVHDPADQVVEPVNPEKPSGQKDRLPAPSKGKKKTTSVAGPPVADVQNQMDTMFRFFSEQNELMFTKLVERIDNMLSEMQSVFQPPAAKKSKVSEPTQFVVTADVHQPSGNDDGIVDNEDVEDDGDDDVDDNDDNDDMDDQDNSDIVFTHPDESESFLGDPDFLPKSAKQERARNLLFTVISELICKEVLRGGFAEKTKDKHVIRDILHEKFFMGSHQVWKNFKTRWSGWERTWPSLVSETSEWILSPTPDDAEENF